jgi:hypothetical protein
VVHFSSTYSGNGTISTHQLNGKELVDLVSTTDEYGNGKVGAYNRKGMGRTLQPGPQ